jgi:hypothetical protein
MVNKEDKKKKFEADFAMFIEPTFATKSSVPSLVIGECKSFNTFEDKDYERARLAMDLFPGAALPVAPRVMQTNSRSKLISSCLDLSCSL